MYSPFTFSCIETQVLGHKAQVNSVEVKSESCPGQSQVEREEKWERQIRDGRKERIERKDETERRATE